MTEHSPNDPCIEHDNGSCDCFVPDDNYKGTPIFYGPTPVCAKFPGAIYSEDLTLDELVGTYAVAEEEEAETMPNKTGYLLGPQANEYIQKAIDLYRDNENIRISHSTPTYDPDGNGIWVQAYVRIDE